MLKFTFKQLFVAMAMLLCSVAAGAYNFEVDGIYYNIISTNNLTVEVTKNDKYQQEEITIPDKVYYNGDYYHVISIGQNAFQGSINIKNVNLPESIITIGSRAFYGCTGLTEFTIPESVTTIGDYAFYGCTGLAKYSNS